MMQLLMVDYTRVEMEVACKSVCNVVVVVYRA